MDLYHKFLGITPEEQPPNRYRLLGLALYESDVEVIENAARRNMRFVREATKTAPNIPQKEVQELLLEIADAKLVLRDPGRRREYDRELSESLPKSGVLRTQPPPQPLSDDGSSEPSSDLRDWDSSSVQGAKSSLPSAQFISSIDDVEQQSFGGASWAMDPSSGSLKQPTTLTGDQEWVIGSSPGVDIRLRTSWVSRRHCRIWHENGLTYIEDLKSTNGTFVNGVPVRSATPLHEEDLITLGRNTRVPWPIPQDFSGKDMRVYMIGRSPDCDFRMSDKSVSQYHAQLIGEGESYVREDLDSLNATRAPCFDRRVSRYVAHPHLSI
ncbi:MAG: FHA domain-containing protein, partial [Planctomycetales bacterium]|nr:FHA domain-containing protein [Planctomycetales bacterium]